MTWAALFERAATVDRELPAIERALTERREGDRRDDEDGTEAANTAADPGAGPRVARVVADADVLAADLLIGGAAREALDHVRRHAWVELLASDALLADAAAVIATLDDDALAEDWRAAIEPLRTPVAHPPGDHPGLASAYRGEAGHLLTFDEGLRSVEANLGMQPHADLSVRLPDAFATLFDPERLYPTVVGGEYPGPDRDPRG